MPKKENVALQGVATNDGNTGRLLNLFLEITSGSGWRSAETGRPIEPSVANDSDQGPESTGRRVPVSALGHRRR